MAAGLESRGPSLWFATCRLVCCRKVVVTLASERVHVGLRVSNLPNPTGGTCLWRLNALLCQFVSLFTAVHRLPW